jgi:hypothetical protein
MQNKYEKDKILWYKNTVHQWFLPNTSDICDHW